MGMPYSIEFDLPGTPKPPNQLLGRSYWAKHKNAILWKRAVLMAAQNKLPKAPLTKVKLSFIRFSNRKLDFDSCVASMKPIADGLTEAGIIIDDRWSVTGVWDVDQGDAKKGAEFIRVRVEEV
jgi:hypothetical protein